MTKNLLKKAFEAGRDYQYNINPYSGKPNNDKVLSFTKWYNTLVKKLTLTDVVKQSELLITFAEWKEYNGKWETHEQQVKNFLKEYKEQLILSSVSGSFTANDVERAYDDGYQTEGEVTFDIENYRY